MRRAFTAVALMLLVLVGIFSAKTAAAIDVQMPGERQLSIHGFYETRLLFTGAELPANGATFSQFRHVLALETEIEIFPDGFGPFDVMFAFTRWAVSYECIYQRGCGLASGADSYGGDKRKLKRVPQNLPSVNTATPFIGGVVEQRFIPGTMRSPIENLNPSSRYRNCINPGGVSSNPFPFAAFCNSFNRSPLDGPIRPGATALDRINAGSFNSEFNIQFLNAARPFIGEDRFNDLRGRLGRNLIMPKQRESERRSRLRAATLLEADGRLAEAAAERELAKGLLFVDRDSTNRDPNNVYFEAAITGADDGLALLETRTDVDRFAILANANAPELRSALWAGGKLSTTTIPFLASVNTPVRPDGYFRGQVLDIVSPFEVGVAETPIDSLSGVPAGIDAGRAREETVPFFVGPDGRSNTADDLPFATGGLVKAAPIPAAGTPFPTGIFLETGQIENPAGGGPLELYGVFDPQNLRVTGCQQNSPSPFGGAGNLSFDFATGTCSNPQTGVSIPDLANVDVATLTPEQVEFAGFLFRLGCDEAFDTGRSGNQQIGINSDGDCIRVNSAGPPGAQRPFDILPLLSDTSFRPALAGGEPIDLTDLKAIAVGGAGLPARPRAADGGIYFETQGARKLIANSHHLVSNLDLDFSEDELRWDHGGSQDEHEFKEGYLEFEMMDSQLFARLGKLIVVWGKTELFRNQDRNNPVDIGNGLFQPLEETRIGQWGANFTFSPEAWMRVGPIEDMRLELLWLFDDFEPTDLGKCGEGSALGLVCLKGFGAMANGLAGIGLVGEVRPDEEYHGLARWDYGVRLEGRWDRFTFAVSDFWGWSDGFYVEPVFEYQRSNDQSTGAPLAAGGTACSYNGGSLDVDGDPAAPGTGVAQGPTSDPSRSFGPNGILGDGDDIFPSVGDCLLFEPDPDSPGTQRRRTPGDVAALHTVNQTIFHTFCTLTFDPDQGFCAFDRLNNPRQFALVTDLLSGLDLITSLAIPGIETLRTEVQQGNLSLLSTGLTTGQFLVVDPFRINDIQSQQLERSLDDRQKALLGCGPAYLAPCHAQNQALWAEEASISSAINPDPNTKLFSFEIAGGVDLLNARGDVITQEFQVLKAFGSGAPVGAINTARGREFVPGINFHRTGSSFDPDGAARPQGGPIGELLDITPDEVTAGDFSRIDPVFTRTGAAGRADFAKVFETDGWVEPPPFAINQELFDKWGALVYDTRIDETGEIVLDETTFRLIDDALGQPTSLADTSNVDGEYCAGFFNNPFDSGCTGLERVSANFERFLIPIEILGPDRLFSPPETLTELRNLVAGDFTLHADGDPIGGVDGKFAANARIFNTRVGGRLVKDVTVMTRRVSTAGFTLVQPDNLVTDGIPEEDIDEPLRDQLREQFREFLESYDETTCTVRTGCFVEVPRTIANQGEIEVVATTIVAMPIAARAFDEDGEDLRINLLALSLDDPVIFGQLMGAITDTETVLVPNEYLGGVAGESTAVMTTLRNTLLGNQDTKIGLDLNGDGSTDLDLDNDGIWDGADDFSPGPITDDNIFCGSGIPGDLFQEALQFDPAFADESMDGDAFKAEFPDGLPPRSPVFCRSLVALAGATAQTLPFRRAGGDGTHGRRDFLWQGGRQLALRYQKNNVFGFGLDFAEDRTKSSWGLEFSWTANRLLSSSISESGLHETDEMVLSISVDRPTFFNFLNPNRSFFLNFQFFIRYLTDFEGGRSGRDGLFGSAEGPLDTTLTFTFFTGYFQDRLNPRVTMLYNPTSSQGALITALSYRWNESFSTQIGWASFFGHPVTSQASYFPALQYTNPAVQSQSLALGRGVTPVLNRDNATLRVRYSF